MGESPSIGPAGAEASGADALSRQRAITERLLLTALHQREVTTQALLSSRHATFLLSASRELAVSLHDSGAREAVRRRTLLREGSWCVVDIAEADGSVHRLSVAHSDPAKQEVAQAFADSWLPSPGSLAAGPASPLVLDASDAENRAPLRALGVGGLLVVPLVVQSSVLGAMTFVTRDGDAPFSPDEVTLASNLADLCALALDNERLYREADALRKAADVASIAKSRFLGNMSHELITPLNAIGGYVSLIEMGLRGPVSTEQRLDLARIRQNQVHLTTLITAMLTFVRSESGRLEYRFTEVPVQRAIREVTDMLYGAAAERQLTIIHQPGDVDAVVWADADRVRQILLNLVMNAVKYGRAAHEEITVTTTTTPGTIRIAVTDDGPGIPEDKLEAIFDPFVQLTNGLTDQRSGVGLGLAISRELAEAMNGELTVSSTVGVGSRFTLELPRARRPAAGPS
jgi:signal transduction histidine kinase